MDGMDKIDGCMGVKISEHYYAEDDGSPKPLRERPLNITRWMTAEHIKEVYGIVIAPNAEG